MTNNSANLPGEQYGSHVDGETRLPRALAGEEASAQTCRHRLLAYAGLIFVLAVAYIPLMFSTWKGNTQIHTLMEVAGTLMAFVVGTFALVRYYTRKDRTLLYIGAGFIGTAFLDGYHCVVTSSFFNQLLPSPPPSLIPWSWNASRLFLAVSMCLAWWGWRWSDRLTPRAQHREGIVYAVFGALTMLSFWFFAFVPLPPAYYPDLILGRPEELIAAALFAVALAGYLKKGKWKSNALDHWCVVSLILGLISQAAVMSRSYVLFDAMFDFAHALKIVSYTCVLVGLLTEMFRIFRQAERVTVRLKDSISQHAAAEIKLLKTNVVHKQRASELKKSELYALDMMQQANDAHMLAQSSKMELQTALSAQVDAVERQSQSIRELEETHAELREQKLRFQGILENVVDAVININGKGIIEEFNSAAEQMFGYLSREVVGRNISILMPSPHRESHNGYLERYAMTGIKNIIGSSRELVGLRKNGEEFPIQLSVSETVKPADGNERCCLFTGIVRDLTEQKRTEAELIGAKERADASNLSKSEFLANMSHEIRTPMTAILGYTDFLYEDGDLELAPERRLSTIDTIRGNANHLLTIINDILDMSKIEAGKMTVENVETSPTQIVEEVATLLQQRALGKGIDLTVMYDSSIPEHIESDPTRLRQILLNLVGNAVKFTEVGNVTLKVAADSDQQILRVSVVDTGIGMSSEQCAVISRFEAFNQADGSTTRKFGGTGLGLRISNTLALMLGGGIDVESEFGEGSTFTLTVGTGDLTTRKMLSPVEIVERKKRATEMVKKRSDDANDKPLLDLRLLLVEDGPDNQRLICFILKKHGAEVVLADNGQIAYDLVTDATTENQPFDVILMDMQMPVMDGYEATRQLRDDGYTHPIIALTAHAMAADRQKCLDAGCDDYTTKPIDKKHLIELVASYAKQTQALKSAAKEAAGAFIPSWVI